MGSISFINSRLAKPVFRENPVIFHRDTWASEGGCMRVQPFCTVKFDIFLIKF